MRVRCVLEWLALLAPLSLPLAAQVVWVDPSTPSGAGVLAGSLMDSLLAEQERLRTTPMVHRKVGLRPEKGEEVTVRPGEVIVALVPFRASYIARPTADFTNTRGMPIRSATFRAVKMLNNKFCYASGGRCFDDKDFDGDWDGAGQLKGRWVDVPYEVIEVRQPIESVQQDLILTESGLKQREYFNGALVRSEDCGAPAENRYRCGFFVVEVIERVADGAVRFHVGQRDE